MKKFMVLSLLAAIGAVAFIDHAQAAGPQDWCAANPALCNGGQQPAPMDGRGGQWNHNSNRYPGTAGGPPPQPSTNPNQRWDHHRRWHGNGWGGNGWNNGGVYLNFNLGVPDVQNRCGDIAWRLRNEGFNNVRPLSCSGGTYVYRAWRDGERLNISVSAYSGRIRRITPAY